MAVTASVGGSAGGDAFTWEISYDDVTRDVTTVATGPGFCLVTVTVQNGQDVSVAYRPAADAVSVKSALAAAMATADFQVIADGSPVTLASNIAANRVSRIVGKAGSGGLPSNSQFSLT